MSLTKASRISGTIGICTLLFTVFLISDASAQRQYCECYNGNRAAVRRAHVSHVAYRTGVRRARYTVRVRTVYRTVYVPTPSAASYTAYADNSDRDYVTTPNARVLVTEPVLTNSYTTTIARVYYADPVARGWGKRDGFKDGYKAALKNRLYNAENNGDYREADNGYKRRFGSKYLYRSSYREGYVEGYDSGFRSVAGGEAYGVVRY